jgi:hypothetical protein
MLVKQSSIFYAINLTFALLALRKIAGEMKYSIATLRLKTVSTMTLDIMTQDAEDCFVDCRLCLVSHVLKCYAECR